MLKMEGCQLRAGRPTGQDQRPADAPASTLTRQPVERSADFLDNGRSAGP
jgi:hypothetical protein